MHGVVDYLFAFSGFASLNCNLQMVSVFCFHFAHVVFKGTMLILLAALLLAPAWVVLGISSI